jgi:hypothetical protein
MFKVPHIVYAADGVWVCLQCGSAEWRDGDHFPLIFADFVRFGGHFTLFSETRTGHLTSNMDMDMAFVCPKSMAWYGSQPMVPSMANSVKIRNANVNPLFAAVLEDVSSFWRMLEILSSRRWDLCLVLGVGLWEQRRRHRRGRMKVSQLSCSDQRPLPTAWVGLLRLLHHRWAGLQQLLTPKITKPLKTALRDCG